MAMMGNAGKMGKQLSCTYPKGVTGGKGHMVGRTTSGTAHSDKRVNQGGGGGGKGGSGHMVGFTGSRPAKAR